MATVERRRAAIALRPLDARAASYRFRTNDAQGTQATASPVDGQKEVLSLVEIEDTVDAPFRHVCLLEIWPAIGKPLQGTGWLVSKRTVITAGHCVYQRDQRSWAFNIRVHLAVNGTGNELYQVQESHNLHSVQQWTGEGQEAYDYGAIILPKPLDAGFFGLSILPDADLQDLLISLLGYPTTTLDNQSMYGDQGFLHSVEPGQIFYDMESEPGMSGGPIFYTKGGLRYAVGIHNYGGSSAGNYGTRISQPVYNDIKAWAALGQ
jgi:V8-like Glu-specific endopeptidase